MMLELVPRHCLQEACHLKQAQHAAQEHAQDRQGPNLPAICAGLSQPQVQVGSGSQAFKDPLLEHCGILGRYATQSAHRLVSRVPAPSTTSNHALCDMRAGAT